MTDYHIIRGTLMTGGYRDNRGSTRMGIVLVGSTLYGCNLDRCWPETYEARLALDIDGLVTRPGACPGYGFLPDAGELARLAALGITIPADEDMSDDGALS